MNRALKDHSKTSAKRMNPCPKSILNQLYEQRHETGDITFIVGSEEISAHRYILAALSPRYKAQFYGAMAEQKTINVQDVSPAAFKEFLQFFYLDEVTLTLENIEDVLNLAKQSLVDELVVECTNFLLDVVGMDKLIRFYRLATEYEVEPLEEFCVDRIGANIKSVFKTSEFLNCEQGMLCRILDLDSLNCDEMNAFEACIAWARAKCEHDGIQAAITENLRAALGDAIFKIRFCSMTGEQFAKIGKTYDGILLGHEKIEVFNAILLKESGEISSIFGANNSKPRKLQQSFIECSFSNGNKHCFGVTFLDFTCDKAILLNGFVVCSRIDESFDVQVEIAGLSQSFDFTKLTSDNETRIIFHNPIHVAANELCYINSKLKESLIKRGFGIVESVQQNGVLFQFGEAGRYYNLITRLLFNNVE